MDQNWEIIATWMHEYGDRLVRTVTVMLGDADEAQDIVQEVFVRAYTSLDRYRKEASPYTYLYAIARNLVRSHKRIDSRRPSETPYDDMVEPSQYPDPQEAAIAKELDAAITTGIARLTFKHREVISLFYISELSIEEIGEVLDVSIGTVKSRLFRAREKLKRYLQKEVGYGPI